MIYLPNFLWHLLKCWLLSSAPDLLNHNLTGGIQVPTILKKLSRWFLFTPKFKNQFPKGMWSQRKKITPHIPPCAWYVAHLPGGIEAGLTIKVTLKEKGSHTREVSKRVSAHVHWTCWWSWLPKGGDEALGWTGTGVSVSFWVPSPPIASISN